MGADTEAVEFVVLDAFLALPTVRQIEVVSTYWRLIRDALGVGTAIKVVTSNDVDVAAAAPNGRVRIHGAT